MRPSILIYFLFLSFPFFSQVRLTDVNFEFKKNNDFHQLVTNVNPNTSEIFTFGADKEKLFGAKFNSFVFFSDSLTTKKPFNFRYLMGCGFATNNNPIAYWATEDLHKFIGIEFDYPAQTTKTVEYSLSFKDHTIFTDFTENGILYFLSEKKNSKALQVTTLQGHKIVQTELDFSKFTFEDENQKKATLLEILNEYGLTKIDKKGFTSFVTASSPVKYYLRENKLLITLDTALKKTQILEIDLTTFEIKEVIFMQDSTSKDIKQTNSLLFEDKVVQLLSNKEVLEINILNYSDKSVLKAISISEANDLPFTGTTFYGQIQNDTPQDLKSTKRFLNKLHNSNLGASLYNLNGKYVATFGGRKILNRNSDFLADLIEIASDYDISASGNFMQQNIYFDVILNSKFDQEIPTKEPLYIDKIAQFTAQNKNVNYEHYFPYKDYYILTYFDKSENKIVLTKFTDGFDY